MKNIRILALALALLTITGTAMAQSPQTRAREAYNKVRQATTVRINSRTTIRPSSSGVEINHRGRTTRTTINLGSVRREGLQSSRSRGYGVSIGARW